MFPRVIYGTIMDKDFTSDYVFIIRNFIYVITSASYLLSQCFLSFPHRTSPLLLTTLLPCTPSPPSSPMRRWCMAWVQAWHPPPSHITSPSIHHLWLFPKSHGQAYVSSIRSSHIFLRIQLTQAYEQCVYIYTVSVQPLEIRGGDAASLMPSVTEGQGEPYWCLVCWHWPSGLEVCCVYSYRSLDIIININLLLLFI